MQGGIDPELPADAYFELVTGADVVSEACPLGMNRAADLGRRRALDDRPDAPVAILVADLPYLRPNDIDIAVKAFQEHCVPIYVADRQGRGTTFLIHGPYQDPEFRFRPPFCADTSAAGYREAVTAPCGLHADLDTPADLDQLGGSILLG